MRMSQYLFLPHLGEKTSNPGASVFYSWPYHPLAMSIHIHRWGSEKQKNWGSLWDQRWPFHRGDPWKLAAGSDWLRMEISIEFLLSDGYSYKLLMLLRPCTACWFLDIKRYRWYIDIYIYILIYIISIYIYIYICVFEICCLMLFDILYLEESWSQLIFFMATIIMPLSTRPGVFK